MTRGEAIINLNMISTAFVETVTKEQRKLIDDTFCMAIKALRQGPILDKIRAEIIDLRSRQNVGVLECLDIIDKYKVESEEQGMNYKSFNLGDWIGHISGVIEDESELDGNEMRDLVEFLSKLPRWIPVSERLPEKNTAVLTYVSTGPSETYCLAYWNDVREGWEEWIGYELIEKERGYKVLAWMPLPKPYKAERENK